MINLVLGDWSGDGHSKTEIVSILSNLLKNDIEKAYKKGCKKVGFDLTKDVCAEYEDMSASKEVVEALRAVGFKPEDFLEEDDDGDWSFAYNGDAFAELWLRIAQLGNPDFKYEITTHNTPNINIGGYGLYE